MYGDSKTDKIVDISFSIMMAGYGLLLGTIAITAAVFAIDNFGIPVYEKTGTITGIYKSQNCSSARMKVSVNVEGQLATGCYRQSFTDGLKVGEQIFVDSQISRITRVISVDGMTKK